ncbi:MAG: AAA family ATPase [Actinobacteria bacterium]|uniref:Unannotated protein n=1 Tax=freshwater metagenome TaxID=449393 RepID=A0A6J6DV75_9ZZZZ|nr:AAA family ATPase [Actinomycetota bacterium]
MTSLPGTHVIKPKIISIDGGIGAGKSTLLAKLKKDCPEWNFIDEPVDYWMKLKDEEGRSILELFYSDKKRWSFTFQNTAYLTRVRSTLKAIENWQKLCEADPSKYGNNVFITERSVETDYNVFAKMLHDSGLLTKIEWDIYRQWFHHLQSGCEVAGIVYLTTNPKTCKERIIVRGREGEDDINLDYLTDLDRYHKKWVSETTIPVLEFNTDGDSTAAIKEFIDSL